MVLGAFEDNDSMRFRLDVVPTIHVLWVMWVRVRRIFAWLGMIAMAFVQLLSVTSCATTPATSSHMTLNVFAAASLKEAFTDIQVKFQATHPGVAVTYNFGGSDTLATQISQGAPADVFASANVKQMNVVVQSGAVDAASVKTFAHNRLVVILPKANPADLHTLQDLSKPNVKLDLAAATVPVGQYALDFLAKASTDPAFGAEYKASVLKNVVSYETDVKMVLSKVALGEADAGIVYTTDAATNSDAIGTIAIPDSLNTIAIYPIASVQSSTRADAATQYVAYVTSTEGQAILARYGFLSASDGPGYTPANI
jgi:molybdate transport system substrate-binding protein